MFDIAWSEFLIVAVVALVVVGPKDLPGLLRNVGRMIGQVRRMAGDFQSQFNEALREAELDGLKREMDDVKNTASKLMTGSDPFKMASAALKDATGSRPLDATPSALAASAAGASPDAPSALAPAPEIPHTEEAPPVSSADFPPRPSDEALAALAEDAPPNPARPREAVPQSQPGAAS